MSDGCPICKNDPIADDLYSRMEHQSRRALGELARCIKDKVSGIDRMIYALVYVDDGPAGVCGQSCNITTPWHHLYIFTSYKAMREFAEKIEQAKYKGPRRNPRVEYIFCPQPEVDQISVVLDDQEG